MEDKSISKVVTALFKDHAIKFIAGSWFALMFPFQEQLSEETTAYGTAAMICGIAAVSFLRVKD